MKSDSAPQLPRWIFFLMDGVLLAAAAYIAAQSHRPLSNAAIFSIVGCVIAAAILGTIPLLVKYERDKNEALDERQRALEGLAQTIAASAEQIGIAANGLNTVVDLAHKNLRHAEQLPHKLQDKMAEFQALLANAENDEKEELEQEIVALRSSETEKLQTISDKITKSTAELTKLENAAQKNLASAQDAMAKLDEKLRATLTAFDARLAALEKVAAAKPTPVIPAAPAEVRENLPANNDAPSTTAAAAKSNLAHPPKNSRPRREEPPATTTPSTPATPSSLPIVEVKELPPVKLQQIVPVAPGTRPPSSATTAESNADSTTNLVSNPPIPVPVIAAAPTAVPAPAPARKRSEKKSYGTSPVVAVKEASSDQPMLALGTETEIAVATRPPVAVATADSEFSQVSPDEVAPHAAVAADGATRLLVTAYIGIGNRLFIRGAGPGLSWDKGVPLQFVSIGKWRWETADATAPVKFKLYKNDETECAALGAQSLDVGHQQELNASF